MKTKFVLSILVCSLILISGCDKENGDVGMLKFETMSSLVSGQKSAEVLKSATVNPPLTGDTTTTITTSLKLAIGDVWVAKGDVKAGSADDLEWIRLTNATNTQQKLFEDYSFSAIEIPAGTYQSIKITFRNVFYRYNYLVSDPSVKYELLETMGSWTDACDENDESWAATNYFGPDGNHNLNDNNVFELVSEGEKIGGFTIDAGKTVVLTWRLFAGFEGTCYTYLIDENSNLAWDCGVDRMDFECVPDSDDLQMWDFLVEYE